MTCRRIILLGASNLQMGMPVLLENLGRQFAADRDRLEIWTAAGHGRSYGRWSQAFFRELPGIVDCRLWEDLRASTVVPDRTYSLVTDIGNDILFGVEPLQIVAWVRKTFEHLSGQNAQIVATGLPLASVRLMPLWKFRLMRRILFPKSQLSLPETLSRAEELHDRITDLTREFNVPLVEANVCWYGFDPIHIRRRSRLAAWQRVLSSWGTFPEDISFSKARRATTLQVLEAAPYEQRWFGRTKIVPQPSVAPRAESGLSWSAY